MTKPIDSARGLSVQQVKQLAVAALLTVTLLAAGKALANGNPKPAVMPVGAATALVRAQVQTDDFEAVVAIEDGHVLVYLDRFATNEAVAGATLKADWSGRQIGVREIAPGTYELLEPALLAPGRHSLTLSVVAGDAADLLSVTLDVVPPAVEVDAGPGRSRWIAWGLAALLLAGGVGVIVMRRSSRTSAMKGQSHA